MSGAEEEKMVRAGETYTHEKITVEIVEVIPYFDIMGRKHFQIAYRIKDGNYVSPVAHLWMDRSTDIREMVRQVVQQYLDIVKPLRG
jgi:hypothetical protein